MPTIEEIRKVEPTMIVNVWEHNLEEEMIKIRGVVERYPYIAMDTEFPGVVARPIGQFRNTSEYHYQSLRVNVDILKIIQLGLTFCDEDGNFPSGACTWQFNFKFDLNEDVYAKDSIDLLVRSGIDFQKNKQSGIDVVRFAELLMGSGIVLDERVRWIAFHSGYDFAYLLKLLQCKILPSEENEFIELLRAYFPNIYDVKYIMYHCDNFKGGLAKLAQDLEVSRIGTEHQAGSDSLLTAAAFFKLRKQYFRGELDDKFLGVLFGLGAGCVSGSDPSPGYIPNGTGGSAIEAIPS